MAAPRKRPPSEPVQKEDSVFVEEKEISEFLETVASETLVEVAKQEEIYPEMTPTEDPGPRFLDEPVKEEVKEIPPQFKKPASPLRHPRNIPKFSRYK
jgi:hypothetical protein